jgi:hypothetical protein
MSDSGLYQAISSYMDEAEHGISRVKGMPRMV